jgi:hypothetical protein
MGIAVDDIFISLKNIIDNNNDVIQTNPKYKYRIFIDRINVL